MNNRNTNQVLSGSQNNFYESEPERLNTHKTHNTHNTQYTYSNDSDTNQNHNNDDKIYMNTEGDHINNTNRSNNTARSIYKGNIKGNTKNNNDTNNINNTNNANNTTNPGVGEKIANMRKKLKLPETKSKNELDGNYSSRTFEGNKSLNKSVNKSANLISTMSSRVNLNTNRTSNDEHYPKEFYLEKSQRNHNLKELKSKEFSETDLNKFLNKSNQYKKTYQFFEESRNLINPEEYIEIINNFNLFYKNKISRSDVFETISILLKPYKTLQEYFKFIFPPHD